MIDVDHHRGADLWNRVAYNVITRLVSSWGRERRGRHRGEGLHVAEAAYFDILIGESECGNPRGGVCNLTPSPALPFRAPLPTPLSFPTLVRPCTIPPLPPFIPPPSLVRFAISLRDASRLPFSRHLRAGNLLLIATAKETLVRGDDCTRFDAVSRFDGYFFFF